jgi:hypothetical protein
MKPEIRAIVEGLLRKSKEDKVAWVHASTLANLNAETEINPSEQDFAVSTANFTINLYYSLSDDPDQNRPIRLNILNEMGELVTFDVIYDFEEEYDLMVELVSLARKYVRGEDKLLKKIMEGLQKPGVFGLNDDDVPF